MSVSVDQPFRALPVDKDNKDQTLIDEFFAKIDSDHSHLLEIIKADPARVALLQTALFEAPFLRDCLMDHPAFAVKLLAHPKDEGVTDLVDETRALDHLQLGERDLMGKLRVLKTKMALGLALYDLGGFWPMEKVTHVLSSFADAALLASIRFALVEEAKRGKLKLQHTATPEHESGLIVLAMGKHGAYELNYSSDIDIMVFYDAEKVAVTDRFDLQPIMVRVTKRFVKIMQERTEHGYVFRTDLRLRPDPGATAVAISTEAALNYYESIGQNWERAAHIKARPVSCDMDAAEAFLKELSPFVWRKYMDFAMIADVHAVKRQMHLHKGYGTIALAEHNIKLGRGGIREIEFFVQTQQLIAGGRNAHLRARGTLEGLALLADAGWIERTIAETLSEKYKFLRNIEHRIQMRHDEQTHTLPKDDRAHSAIGRMMGYSSHDAFDADLLACFQTVASHYAKLFEEAEDSATKDGFAFPPDDNDPDTLQTLSSLGYDNVEQVSYLVRQWYAGHYKAMRSEQAREALAAIVPKFLTTFAKAASPDQAVFSFDAFLKNLPAGLQLFSLLKANDGLLDLLSQLMGNAPRLADTIARKPHIFDALLEPAFFDTIPTQEQLSQQLRNSFDDASGYEDCLDRLRIFVEEQRFLIGTRLLSGTITPLGSQALYSDLADVVIVELLPLVIREVSKRHGVIEGADITVLAMGKLGGREMTPTSDLDIILIYDTAGNAHESNGLRPLAISQYFIRLTQRFIAALSAPTGEGVAYEVDMRLRPSGRAGPLATEIEDFTRYQNEAAWTWEHMALTRARAIGGSNELRARVDKVIFDVLCKDRDLRTLRSDVSEMNELLHDAKKAANAFGLKEARGGLVDIEFIAQFVQLAAKSSAEAIFSTSTRTALELCKDSELLSVDDKNTLISAFALFSNLIQMLRLCVVNEFDPETAPRELKERLFVQADIPDFRRLMLHLEEVQQSVRGIYCNLINSPQKHER